jgi:uncharacterized protein YciI
MFLTLLMNGKPLGEIDGLIDDHDAYLEPNYATGPFPVSGRREPRTDGVIIARAARVGALR